MPIAEVITSEEPERSSESICEAPLTGISDPVDFHAEEITNLPSNSQEIK